MSAGQPPVNRRAQHARHQNAQRAEERDDVEHGVSAGGALEERHEERHAGGYVGTMNPRSSAGR